MANPPKYFGQCNSTVAIPHSFLGMPGWWQVPASGFYYRADPNNKSQLQFSPNADFSRPVYYASMDYDGTFVFQDQLANKMARNGEQGSC